jgi:UDP-N-acetylmuramyl pentapeptide phosphotransferase/UDP-N-acetylglucosamine-1-phosphate transferase
MTIFAAFFVSLIGCIAAIKLVQSSELAAKMLDLPNHRSLHSDAIPRIGGIGVFFGSAFGLFFSTLISAAPSTSVISLSIGALLLFLISLMDDNHSLGAPIRLLAHAAVATGWLWFILFNNNPSQHLLNGWGLLAFVVLAIGVIWSINLYNFMDGSDGLATCMSIIGLTSYSIVALAQGKNDLFMFSGIVASACIGFFYFNRPKASVFLGDCGSISLGFIAAGVGMTGVVEEAWSPLFPVSLFAMFWVDATFTLCTRIVKRERFWEGHRQHWYQKAIRAGNNHLKVLIIHSVCNSLIAVVAITNELFPFLHKQLVSTSTICFSLLLAGAFGFWATQQFKFPRKTK